MLTGTALTRPGLFARHRSIRLGLVTVSDSSFALHGELLRRPVELCYPISVVLFTAFPAIKLSAAMAYAL
jgi:hypothetical protein